MVLQLLDASHVQTGNKHLDMAQSHVSQAAFLVISLLMDKVILFLARHVPAVLSCRLTLPHRASYARS
jgi:hypothetical protein